MDRTKTVAGDLDVACMDPGWRCACCAPRAAHSRVVGSKNFTEQVLLGEILAQQIERRLGVTVERQLNLGGTLLAHEALVQGIHRSLPGIHRHRADRHPEAAARFRSAPQCSTAVRAAYRQQVESGVAGAARLQRHLRHDGARRNGAHRPHWLTLSDAARAQAWRLGAGYEFRQRPDGLDGLLKTYGLRTQGDPVTMDLGLLYSALDRPPGGYDRGQLHRRPGIGSGRHHPAGRPALFPAL